MRELPPTHSIKKNRNTVKPYKANEFKGNRQDRRQLAREMNKVYKLRMWEVEMMDAEFYYVIALNIDHVIEIMEACEEKIDMDQIYYIKPLNPEQMKLIQVDDNTLLEAYRTYEGDGDVVCSSIW